MEEFIETVRDNALKGALQGAISGPKPFRNFRNVLSSNSEERDRWFNFQEEFMRQEMEDWLEAKGIKPEWINLPKRPRKA
jgi:hypothetical protein